VWLHEPAFIIAVKTMGLAVLPVGDLRSKVRSRNSGESRINSAFVCVAKASDAIDWLYSDFTRPRAVKIRLPVLVASFLPKATFIAES